ncbi:29_t:CDS:1 [Ambispora gerdemannii]|uniref:29_t:CDS:1 n=1 Tax=Ambispora gerdemannii TaxID=144530 RepID=A0A9N8VQZ2_9GLOM|nr:29_t:CDS:1 [Ambispora gerdemannii]
MCKNISEISDLVKRFRELFELYPCESSANDLCENLLALGKDRNVKKPPNSFMIFQAFIRSQLRTNEIPENLNKIKNQKILSKVSAEIWNKFSEEDQQIYRELKQRITSMHKEKYPDWKSKQTRTRATFRVHALR